MTPFSAFAIWRFTLSRLFAANTIASDPQDTGTIIPFSRIVLSLGILSGLLLFGCGRKTSEAEAPASSAKPQHNAEGVLTYEAKDYVSAGTGPAGGTLHLA